MFWKVLYKLIGMKMPMSESKIGFIKFGLLGKKIRAFSFCKWVNNGSAKNINIQKGVHLNEMVKLGDKSGIGKDSVLNGKVVIGNNVMIGEQLICYTVNHKYNDIDKPIIEQGFDEMKPINIEDDVWIGGRVTILPGVTVSKGSVIGAGSVVTHNTRPYSVNAGNPARFIRERNA